MSTHENIVQAFNNYLAEAETFEDKPIVSVEKILWQ